MAKQFYQQVNFRPAQLALVAMMNDIIDDYVAQGFRLTVRQLYYQLVSKAVIQNTEQSYSKVCEVVNRAKLGGLMDWDAIQDRTREFTRQTRWDSPAHILRAASDGYHHDMWEGQPERVFAIVEKEALLGILEGACRDYDVPVLAARGYPSGTVLREFYKSDIQPAQQDGQDIIILHLGDHDPSGIDMSRDLEDRLDVFSEEVALITLERIALNMSQIKAQKPPPNPAKVTDSRFAGYEVAYGKQSWELDALSPTFIDGLVRSNIDAHILDKSVWQGRQDLKDQHKAKIKRLGDRYK